MAQPFETPSPFPPGTTRQVIWVGANGEVLPDAKGAVRGEVVVYYPDGRVESTMFTTEPQPTEATP